MEPMRTIEHGNLVHRCFRCGYCKFPSDYVDFNCPSYKAAAFDTYSSGGRMWLIRAWLNNEIKTGPRFADILYSCVACGNCTEQCVYPGFKDHLLDIFEEAKGELVGEGLIPPTVRDYFKAITVNGNPYKLPQNERGKWAEGINIEEYSDQDYLFYVGCVGSYDEVGMHMARNVGTVLKESGLSVGILGSGESCDGNEVKILGETGLFLKLAEDNIRQFNELGVKKIITLDPHAMNTFKKYYPEQGGRYQIYHYTEILDRLIRDKQIIPVENRITVTYHDPCYLGRHHHIYKSPRSVLKSIPGLELVEMRRNGVDAFCCGGGGGNFFTDINGSGEESPSRVRIREALDTGASIVAVACPQCAKMLTDAVKAEEMEGTLVVKDVAEILRESI
ncbi:MAG: (Fe-S)-binding protein [Desulfatiglans sp.]|jgi:Fe-S oxidoreductase|nr:(Fe-S)-binding protein [Thermodesulfobacteriota bacterium]MEE4354344.1 (Fe-S)-binding protein [Desulfatiglans sp.]